MSTEPDMITFNDAPVTENTCYICYTEMTDETSHTLPECGHRFHSNCLITWFRQTGTCPYCRATHMDMCSPCTLKLIKSFARSKRAPKQLRQLVKKLHSVEKKRTDASREYGAWKKSDEGQAWNHYRTISNSMRKNIYKYYHVTRSLEHQIGSFPILPVPVIIPQPSRRSQRLMRQQ
jgi:hypothetical protein